METTDCVSLMAMYEDESVEVRYRNGTQLQLSPCGCEFLLVNPTDPHGRPLQPTERVRQRTRFTVSKYKEQMIAALTFRNKYATRPYLPEELIPVDHKKPFFSMESGVVWPEWSSEAELGPGGNIIVRSEGGHALLVLLLSGEEFFVEFTCSLSQSQNQHKNNMSLNRDPDRRLDSPQQVISEICNNTEDQSEVVHRQGRGETRKEPTQARSYSQGDGAAQQKPEQKYQSTKVVQHHSCCAVSPPWSYPLSLAQHHLTSSLSKCKDADADAEGTSSSRQDMRTSMSDKSLEARRSQLPQALPLTCSSPHWHRWNFKDPLSKELESDISMELVKLLWCQGVTYRILSGAVPVIEISPGDGSVIRSNGILNSYFIHHKPKPHAEEELTYHLNSLPPDVPGQLYSLCSIVSRASRILSCYNQAQQSLKLPATPSCIQEDHLFSKSTLTEQNSFSALSVKQHVNMPQAADSLSDVVAAELEKIKRFNFLLENCSLLRHECKHRNLEESSSEITPEPVNKDYVAEALQRTSKAIQDIDALISAATLT